MGQGGAGGGVAPPPQNGGPPQQERGFLEQLVCSLCAPVCKEFGIDLEQVAGQQGPEGVQLTQPGTGKIIRAAEKKYIYRIFISKILSKDAFFFFFLNFSESVGLLLAQFGVCSGAVKGREGNEMVSEVPAYLYVVTKRL